MAGSRRIIPLLELRHDVFPPSAERSVHRVQRFLLCHIPGHCRGGDGFPDHTDFWKFRHSKADRAEAGATHSRCGRQGTPTMGGALVIGAVFVSSLIWARPDNRFVWLALFSMIYLGALGFVDDYLKVTKKKSEGISGRLKLVSPIALAAVVT